MRDLVPEHRPLLILAPMQDITDLAFWRVLSRYGGPDVYYTEYFRVHRDSRPEKYILRSIDENPNGKPIIAQMIGQDISALQRTAIELQKRKIAGIDINFGCPAPIVCRKDAGGGLLRHPEKIDEATRAHYAALYARPRAMHDAFEQFHAFPQDGIDNRALLAKGKLAMPVLALGAEKSYGTAMKDDLDKVATHVTGGVIPDSGHWVIEENPITTTKLVTDFLAK